MKNLKSCQYPSINHLDPTEQGRKRAVRLQKNREAARECRRKKKEYIKCLENRVAVLEVILNLSSKVDIFCEGHLNLALTIFRDQFAT